MKMNADVQSAFVKLIVLCCYVQSVSLQSDFGDFDPGLDDMNSRFHHPMDPEFNHPTDPGFTHTTDLGFIPGPSNTRDPGFDHRIDPGLQTPMHSGFQTQMDARFQPPMDPRFQPPMKPGFHPRIVPGFHHMHEMNHHDFEPPPPEDKYPVQYAGLPQNLVAYPLPLKDSYHELKFNITWKPSETGPPARDYSIGVTSITDTVDCHSPMCYEYNIPGVATWWVVPEVTNPVADTCAIRPGCTYNISLIAHPWDGHTAAYHRVELNECEEGVCSCAHSPRLPSPIVTAKTISIEGEIFVNVTWITPPPQFPQRLPPGLRRQKYVISIGKQMVTDAHPSPWFANTAVRYIETDGLVADGDVMRWKVLPITEKSEKRSDKRNDGSPKIRFRTIVLDVRLLARVSLVDERGCVGPAGNATAYDPADASSSNRNMSTFGHYMLWAVLGGACVATMCAFIAVSARVVKRILNVFRPAAVSAPLDAPRRRPAWFPLQLRTSTIFQNRLMYNRQQNITAPS